MSASKPVRLLVEHGREEILRRWRPDSCIASTAVGIKVLTRFGVRAWPVPVDMHAYSPAYLAMTQHFRQLGRPPTKEEVNEWTERGAWTVTIDESSDTGDQPFMGHLVIGVPGYLVDLSLDQAARPHKGMHLEPVLTSTDDAFYEGEIIGIRVNHTLVTYHHRPEYLGYRTSPDWTEDSRHTEAVARIEATIRRKLQRRRKR